MSGILLLTITCMSGSFLLTFYVRYITSDYLDLLGLSSLFSLPGDPLVRILNSETYICEQKPVYVIRPVLSGISCVRYTYASVSMQLYYYISYCIFNYMYIHIPWTCGVIYIYISCLSIYILYRRTYTLCTCI